MRACVVAVCAFFSCFFRMRVSNHDVHAAHAAACGQHAAANLERREIEQELNLNKAREKRGCL